LKIPLSLQRYEEAISYFDKALEIDQFEITILCNDSIAKLTVGDKETL
jgi:tetratricopeptide (TPR) repeat protein